MNWSLTNDLQLENSIKRYFFGYFVGNRIILHANKANEKQDAKYAFGDESHDYDN